MNPVAITRLVWRFPQCSLLLAGSLLLTGCAGYSLGPVGGAVAGARSVEVRPFVNQTLEPRLADAMTSQMRKQLQRDATFKLVREDADIVLSGSIVRYERRELSFSPQDVRTVRDYRIAMVAKVTALERSSGKLLLDAPVTGYTLVHVGDDLVSAERQSLPSLAADLARNVTTMLAEGKW